MRTRGGVWFAVAALIALLAAASASAKAPREFFGVVPQGSLTSQDFERMGQGQVGSLRLEIFWAAANPSPGVYEWGPIDALVGDAARNDIRLIPFVYSTPQWVAQLDGHDCSPAECLSFAPQKAEALEAWKTFLREAIGRYGPNGSFWTLNPLVPKKPIEIWQIWNEQNSPSFYKPKPNVKKFAKLLKASDEAISATDPSAEVILGGMFGTPLGGQKPGISAWKFLRKLYDIKGAKGDFDGVAPHPYASQLSNVRAQVELIREEMKAGGDRNAELWVTEVGWASDGPANPLNKGENGQARQLKELYQFFINKRGPWNVETVDWYSWRDNPDTNAGLCEWCAYSGLFTEDLTAKPAWREFVKFTGGS